jgi:hypothetical protein
MSLEGWFNLDFLTRACLIDIVNAKIQKVNAQSRDREEMMKLNMAMENSKVKLPFDTPSTTNRILNM